MQTFLGRIVRRHGLWLATVAAIGLGIVLRGDLLHAGFYTDDFDHYAMVRGLYPIARSPLDLFNFGSGAPSETQALLDSGHFPWWSASNIHLSMLRPLSSALISFDFAAFGLDARWFHAHSFLWWAAMVLAAAWLLRAVLPTPMAALAIFLFVLEEGHSFPVGWLANRSTLVATALGFVGVSAHIRARVQGRPILRWASAGCLALSLLSGEYAFGSLAYLAAYELAARDEPPSVRLRALAPAVALAGTYLLVRQSLGIGIDGSGFYISVTAEPLTFLRAAAWRVPVLAGDLAFGIPADWYLAGAPWRQTLLRTGWFSPDGWRALPDWTTWHVVIGACALGSAAYAARRLPLWIGPQHARAIRFLLLGAVLSLVPGAGGMVSARLTVAASLGFDALVAALLLRTFAVASRPARTWTGVGAAIGCTLLLYVHVHWASTRSAGEARWQRHRAALELEWVLGAEVEGARLHEQRVFVLSSMDLTSAWFLPYVRAAVGASVPRSHTLLSGASQPHDVVRVSDRQFDLIVLSNNVDLMAVGGNYRAADLPFREGDVVDFQGIRAEVTRVLRGQPRAVRFTFPKSVDDPEYLFLFSSERGLRRVKVPAVGQTLRLRRPVYPNETSLRWLAEDRAAGLVSADTGVPTPG